MCACWSSVDAAAAAAVGCVESLSTTEAGAAMLVLDVETADGDMPLSLFRLLLLPLLFPALAVATSIAAGVACCCCCVAAAAAAAVMFLLRERAML